jgi:NAD(P)-dependent dehydrogenase (short-subunit alcohol dehydrogenase family)
MINPLDLIGRTVLVTGASAGIGRATAVLLSRLGAHLVLMGRNPDRLQQTLEALEGGCHRAEAFDLADLDGVPSKLSQIVETAGALHGLVHCAGVTALTPLRVLTTEHLERMMRVNFYAAAALTREFSRKRNHQDGASVVLVASVAGLSGVAGRSAYSASKGAVVAFTKSAALELAKSGIRVNCVAPAYVRTEMYDSGLAALTPEQLAAVIAATQPLGLGEPADVANAIAFLLASSARWITGTVLSVDGGYTAQ